MPSGVWSECSSGDEDHEDPPSDDNPCLDGAKQQEAFESCKEEISGSWDDGVDDRGAPNFGVVCGNWGGG